MNGVNGAGLRRRRGPAPGNDALEELQDHRDRQPVTVAPCNKASYAKNIRKVSSIFPNLFSRFGPKMIACY